MDSTASAFHGGAFWGEVGAGFDDLRRMSRVVSADVLDAWFPPAPECLQVLRENLEICCRCSPPSDGSGLLDAISCHRGVPVEGITLGAGSSALIFLALRQWLTPRSRVLILDPMYGEYAHVLSNVVGCEFETLPLHRSNGYKIDLDEMVRRGSSFDWMILVNPNSPTGTFVRKPELLSAIRALPIQTQIWVDEAYVEYVGSEHSLEGEASRMNNLVVCKSLSKSYALSGMRAAYLVSSAERSSELRQLTPPWSVSFAGQLAGVYALRNADYYEQRYAETHKYRSSLRNELIELGLDVLDGDTNSLLVHFQEPVKEIIDGCRAQGVYLRDVNSMFANGHQNAVRIAVRSPRENALIVQAISGARKLIPA